MKGTNMIHTPVTPRTVITEGMLVLMRTRTYDPRAPTDFLARIHTNERGTYLIVNEFLGDPLTTSYGGVYKHLADHRHNMHKVWTTAVNKRTGEKEPNGNPLVSSKLVLLSVVDDGTMLPCGYVVYEGGGEDGESG